MAARRRPAAIGVRTDASVPLTAAGTGGGWPPAVVAACGRRGAAARGAKRRAVPVGGRRVGRLADRASVRASRGKAAALRRAVIARGMRLVGPSLLAGSGSRPNEDAGTASVIGRGSGGADGAGGGAGEPAAQGHAGAMPPQLAGEGVVSGVQPTAGAAESPAEPAGRPSAATGVQAATASQGSGRWGRGAIGGAIGGRLGSIGPPGFTGTRGGGTRKPAGAAPETAVVGAAAPGAVACATAPSTTGAGAVEDAVEAEHVAGAVPATAASVARRAVPAVPEARRRFTSASTIRERARSRVCRTAGDQRGSPRPRRRRAPPARSGARPQNAQRTRVARSPPSAPPACCLLLSLPPHGRIAAPADALPHPPLPPLPPSGPPAGRAPHPAGRGTEVRQRRGGTAVRQEAVPAGFTPRTVSPSASGAGSGTRTPRCSGRG